MIYLIEITKTTGRDCNIMTCPQFFSESPTYYRQSFLPLPSMELDTPITTSKSWKSSASIFSTPRVRPRRTLERLSERAKAAPYAYTPHKRNIAIRPCTPPTPTPLRQHPSSSKTIVPPELP